jgi:hypothetical protein
MLCLTEVVEVDLLAVGNIEADLEGNSILGEIEESYFSRTLFI